MAPYSFLSVSAAINGPNGSFSLSDGNADGGISTAMRGPKNTLTIGAGGEGMNSLHADQSATYTVRLLKTAPTNAQLMEMYTADEADPSAWGRNTITIRDVNRGDHITGKKCAFQKMPDNTYDKEGPAMEWVFDVTKHDSTLGTGN